MSGLGRHSLIMSILFVAGLPRSSNLGVADLLHSDIDLHQRPVVMTGHLHLAAALSGLELSQYNSPLHLYNAKEALVRSLLFLHQMPVSIDTYEAIIQCYFREPEGTLHIDRFLSMLGKYRPLLIDPSFSHCIDPSLIKNLVDLGVECNLLILWRNPVDFSLDLMSGIYGFDSCLQWILASPLLSFPLDPLMLWLKFVKPYVNLLHQSPSTLKHVIDIPREELCSTIISDLCTSLSLDYSPKLRSSSLAQTTPLFSECPYSGDPSYEIQSNGSRPMTISFEQLSRFSKKKEVIAEVVEYAQLIGYDIMP